MPLLLLLLLVTGLVGQLLFNSKPPPEEEAEAVLGNARNLMIAYQRWKAQAKQNGADRKLVLPLGYSKGLSAEFTQVCYEWSPTPAGIHAATPLAESAA